MHPDAKRLNDLSERIIGAAIDVHRALGPGLLESVYEECLCHELQKRGVRFERQKALPVMYGEVKLSWAFRMDRVVESAIVVEIKSIARWERVHEAQLLYLLNLSALRFAL